MLVEIDRARCALGAVLTAGRAEIGPSSTGDWFGGVVRAIVTRGTEVGTSVGKTEVCVVGRRLVCGRRFQAHHAGSTRRAAASLRMGTIRARLARDARILEGRLEGGEAA